MGREHIQPDEERTVLETGMEPTTLQQIGESLFP